MSEHDAKKPVTFSPDDPEKPLGLFALVRWARGAYREARTIGLPGLDPGAIRQRWFLMVTTVMLAVCWTTYVFVIEFALGGINVGHGVGPASAIPVLGLLIETAMPDKVKDVVLLAS